MAGYYDIPSGVRPSVRTISDRLLEYLFTDFFFKFCIHIVIRDMRYAIVNGKNLSILTELLPLFILENLFPAYYPLPIYDISMELNSYVYHKR